MVKLGDIIDLIWVAADKPIFIWGDDGKVFEYGEDDITDELSYIVDSIDIYDDKVEIYLEDKGEWAMNKVKFFHDTNGNQIEKEINEFALKHKIINVSYAVDLSSAGYYSTQAMVLYKTSFWRKK